VDRRREFEQAVQRAVEEDGLLARGARVLVAVSGGPDSLALLTVLNALAPPDQLDLRLAVSHLNHRWRSVESDRDALVVAAVARSLGLECFVGDAGGVLAGSRRNREARARTARLAFLRRVADAWEPMRSPSATRATIRQRRCCYAWLAEVVRRASRRCIRGEPTESYGPCSGCRARRPTLTSRRAA